MKDLEYLGVTYIPEIVLPPLEGDAVALLNALAKIHYNMYQKMMAIAILASPEFSIATRFAVEAMEDANATLKEISED